MKLRSGSAVNARVRGLASVRANVAKEKVRRAACTVELLEVRRMLAGWTTVGGSGTPAANGSSMMLLTDGTVMATANSPVPSASWFKLTPNGNDYANGA